MNKGPETNPYRSPPMGPSVSRRHPATTGLAKRISVVGAAAVASTIAVFVAFCLFWPNFAPLQMMQTWGARSAADDVVAIAFLPWMFIAPALLVPIVAPAFSRWRRSAFAGYLIVSLSGLTLVTLFVVREGKEASPRAFEQWAGVFFYFPISATAIAAVGLALSIRWLLAKPG